VILSRERIAGAVAAKDLLDTVELLAVAAAWRSLLHVSAAIRGSFAWRRRDYPLNAESSYDWVAEQWTVPINLGISQVIRIGDQAMSFQIGGKYYAEVPEGGPEWGIRSTLIFLVPKQ
jgi:hypothetical protein